jgi:hypothetical protein
MRRVGGYRSSGERKLCEEMLMERVEEANRRIEEHNPWSRLPSHARRHWWRAIWAVDPGCSLPRCHVSGYALPRPDGMAGVDTGA